MYEPRKENSYSKKRDVGSYPSFEELLLIKKSLYEDMLKDFDGKPPVSIDDSCYSLEIEDYYGTNIIVLSVIFFYENTNFKSEMKEYKEWKKDQENIARLQEQVRKDYEASKNLLKT